VVVVSLALLEALRLVEVVLAVGSEIVMLGKMEQ
jgi:hypothetical protein